MRASRSAAASSSRRVRDRRHQLGVGFVQRPSGGLAVLDGRQRAETGLDRGQRSALAEHLLVDGDDFVERRRRGDVGQRRVPGGANLVDHCGVSFLREGAACALDRCFTVGGLAPSRSPGGHDISARWARRSPTPGATRGTEIGERAG